MCIRIKWKQTLTDELLKHNDHPNEIIFQQRLGVLEAWKSREEVCSFLSKVKAARYEEEGSKETIPHLWSSSIQKHNRNAELGIHHWSESRQWFYKGSIRCPSAHDVCSRVKIINVQRIFVDKRYGYGYLKEIVVKRVDRKEYMFTEADFPRFKRTKKDKERTKSMMNKIEKKLKERRRMRRLEGFVGGRRVETDYRLLVRPE
ncbi:hypothetical protein Tco_0779935 [Tanacetum coccineum]